MTAKLRVSTGLKGKEPEMPSEEATTFHVAGRCSLALAGINHEQVTFMTVSSQAPCQQFNSCLHRGNTDNPLSKQRHIESLT